MVDMEVGLWEWGGDDGGGDTGSGGEVMMVGAVVEVWGWDGSSGGGWGEGDSDSPHWGLTIWSTRH